MGRLRSLSPNELALVTAIATLVMASCFVLPLPHMAIRLASGIVAAVVFALAAGTALWCESQLRDGIRSDQWEESQVALLRRVAGSVWLKVVIVCGFGVFFAGSLFELGTGHNHSLRSVGWSGWIVGMYATRLVGIFVKPRANSSPPRLSPRDLKPLQSNHWGTH